MSFCIALVRGCVMGVRYFNGGRGSFGSAVLRYAGVLTVSVGAAIWSGAALWDAVVDAPFGDTASSTNAPSTASAVLESGDDWMQNVRSEKFWSNKSGGSNKSAKSEPRAGSGPDFSQRSGLIKTSVPTPSSDAKFPPKSLSKAPESKSDSKNERTDGSSWYSGDGHYRTLCVRLCDGFYWPVSFSTDSDNFDRDKGVCEKSCGGSQTRLFVHDNPGQDIDQMVDLKGVPYTKLRTAFLFRTSYDQSCKCNPHPWEQASKDRHRIYALESEKRKGSQHAAAELTRMKSALIEARKTATAVRTASVEPTRAGSTRTDVTPAAGSAKRMARHAPLSGQLTGDEMLEPSAQEVPAGRLQQWAQMMPQAIPAASLADAAPKLPAPPFALPNVAPPIPMPKSSSQQTASLAVPAKPAAVAKHDLAVAAPPIIARANDELGIKAPLAVNTAQLEQINVARKSVAEQPKVAQIAQNAPKPKVAVVAPEPRAEPKPQREPKREPRETPRVAVARPAPAPKPAVRVAEAPRPQQITAVRNDGWRLRAFETRN